MAYYLIVYVFRYSLSFQSVSRAWSGILFVFFTLYAFLSLGLGGAILLAAWIWRKDRKPKEPTRYPTISFIIPAYNEEKLIPKCLRSLFENAGNYRSRCEIIMIDDGSTDHTYEHGWTTINECRRQWPHVSARIIRSTANMGKAEAIRTGVNKAIGEYIATVDADTWWNKSALQTLVENAVQNGKAATSGFIHPSGVENDRQIYIVLQQLEYSQGLGIFRSAQALGNAILVVPGPMGLYDGTKLREILNRQTLKSVTEDLEITLEMQREKLAVGYSNDARSTTEAPSTFSGFWKQRLRWFSGSIHNIVSIHRDMLFSKSWISLVMWHALIIGYGGGMIELAALFSLPFFFYFAPDRIFFILNLLVYALFVLAFAAAYQAIALRFSYGKQSRKRLLLYTPLYFILRFINICAEVNSLLKYLSGNKGRWQK